MKIVIVAFVTGVLAGILNSIFMVEVLHMTHFVTNQQASQAENKCGEDGWKKIDYKIIHCNNGAKYKLEE